MLCTTLENPSRDDAVSDHDDIGTLLDPTTAVMPGGLPNRVFFFFSPEPNRASPLPDLDPPGRRVQVRDRIEVE